MIKLFKKKIATHKKNENIHSAMSGSELINHLSLTNDIRRIKQLTALNPKTFESLYLEAIYAFAELAQLAPASQAHHHAKLGGMIAHTLSVCEKAIFERKKHTLPISSTPEEIERQKHLWTYACFAGALLHDVGKLVTMLDYLLKDNQKHNVYTVMKTGTAYKLVFKKSPYSFHDKIALSFFSVVIPPVGQGFLSDNLNIYHELIAWLNKDKANWGSIGEIVKIADMESTAEALRLTTGERQFKGAVYENVGQRMMTILRINCASQTPKNRPGATWWVDGKWTYGVSKNVCNIIKEGFIEANITDYPNDNSRIFDELMQYNFIEENEEQGGVIFNIEISERQFNQTFTVLKFETNKLFNISTLPTNFHGTIKEVTGNTTITANKPEPKQINTETNNKTTGAGIKKAEPENTTTEPENNTEKKTTNTDNQNNKTESAIDQKAVTVDQNKTASAGIENKETGAGIENKETGAGIETTEIVINDYSSSDEIVRAFFTWCRNCIIKKEMIVNKSHHKLHIVEAKGVKSLAVVSPSTFIEFGVDVLGLQLENDKGLSIAKCVQHHIHAVKANTPSFNGQVWKGYMKNTAAPTNAKLNLYIFNLENKYVQKLKIEEFTEKVNSNIYFK